LCCVDFHLEFFPRSLHLRGHDICKRCIRKYLQITILEHSEIDIRCPAGTCIDFLAYDEVKQHCVKSTFARSVSLLLHAEIDSTNFCSRKHWNRIQISAIVPTQRVLLDRLWTTEVDSLLHALTFRPLLIFHVLFLQIQKLFPVSRSCSSPTHL